MNEVEKIIYMVLQIIFILLVIVLCIVFIRYKIELRISNKAGKRIFGVAGEKMDELTYSHRKILEREGENFLDQYAETKGIPRNRLEGTEPGKQIFAENCEKNK